ncbi:X-Pro dipeptidyl-peptidase-like protein [Krasilnikovia cinnamomea]|uniref:X-Pro dipeptidyl-peptidase-like protein n=1 Tax=Krasilnikovia cinnamomea TaxID=349313 RepID=A0A4Q7ZF97_9ACTN|nr:CocE/NonD family hydrolase [Krasilnikovia cinnamomea]RZU49397.1 X-Pro dipeptidyl-peptidase-like protein [Krasilnikovia cinnamomea]
MTLRRILTSLAAVMFLIVGGPATAAVATTTATSTVASARPALRLVDITASDGVVLKANVMTPVIGNNHPAIVFAASWGLSDAEYLVQATKFAQDGFVVLSYTTRGFWFSGGKIDVAGPKDIDDAKVVVDWLIANTPTDPTRIGFGGVSYGSGISLLAAANDPRIRSVVMMSGWTDLVQSLYADQTRHVQSTWLLLTVGRIVGRLSDEFKAIADDFFAGRNVPALIEYGAKRSAMTYLAQLQRNRPAIMMAQAYGDSVFGPNQHVDFFNAYHGPKRLEYAPGDHAIPEMSGLAGLPNHVWTSTHRWFGHYLNGVDNGIDTDDALVLQVRNAHGKVEQYPDWAHVTGSTTRYHLGDKRWTGSGPMSTNEITGNWSERISTAGDTVADSGVVILSNTVEGLTGRTPHAWLPAVDRRRGVVWSTDWLRATPIRGMPRMHLTVRPSAANGTVVAYLYDVNAVGRGALITQAPISWVDAKPGEPITLDLRLPLTAWDVPSGHYLSLVVDTKDPLYQGTNSRNASVTVTGPSWFELPLR